MWRDRFLQVHPAVPGRRQAARESFCIHAPPEGDPALRHERPDSDETFIPTIHRKDDGRTIHVIVPLNGIAEEQVRFDLEKTKLTLTIIQGEEIVKKTVQVPRGMRFFKKKFHDGILEIILEKPAL